MSQLARLRKARWSLRLWRSWRTKKIRSCASLATWHSQGNSNQRCIYSWNSLKHAAPKWAHIGIWRELWDWSWSFEVLNTWRFGHMKSSRNLKVRYVWSIKQVPLSSLKERKRLNHAYRCYWAARSILSEGGERQRTWNDRSRAFLGLRTHYINIFSQEFLWAYF